ncbi:heterokaryon incompatibility protein-domain-containing protein [Xylaria arbuscula]|nr:heterokaryon incompatibility protein-domain-containing protein [Xylaria arbuscula]
MDTFRYQPLDLNSSAFRVIHLFKGPTGSDIKCELINTTLDDEVISYEAVSYTWGSPEKEFSIRLDGMKFKVTANLWYLLGTIRKAEVDRYLWVDAIAINQDDKLERGHQVQRMQAIYSRAERVLFYLGEETAQISALMESLVLLQRHVSGRMWASNDERWGAAWETIQSRHDASANEVTQRQGFEELLRRPWFRRAWILQEVANARSALVICGTSSIRAQIFAMAPKFLGVNLDSHASAVFDLMPTHFGDKSRKTREGRLLSTLLDFRGSEASDPYDKIYALLGLCKEEGAKQWIIPDYTQDESDVIYTTVCFISGINGTRPMSTARWLLTEAISLLPSIEHAMSDMQSSSENSSLTIYDLMSEIACSLAKVNQLVSRPEQLLSLSVRLLYDITWSLSELERLLRSAYDSLFEKATWLLSVARSWLSTLKYLPSSIPATSVRRICPLPRVNTPLNIGGFLSSLTDSQDGHMHRLILDILSTWNLGDLRSFLHQRDNKINITWETIEAALLNEFDAKDSLDLLLRYGRFDIANFDSKNIACEFLTRWFRNRLRSTLTTLPREDLCSLLLFASQDCIVRSALGLERGYQFHDAMECVIRDGLSTGFFELQAILERKAGHFRHDNRNRSREMSEEISHISPKNQMYTADMIRKWPVLLIAIAMKAVIVVERLFEIQPGEYNIPCDSANLAFKLALDSRDERLLRCLLNNGVKLTLREYEAWEKSYNPLQVLYHHKDLTNLFRLYPMNLVTQPDLKTTPLNFAASCGDKQLLEFLLNQGADLKATDGRGQTALDVAKEKLAWETLGRDPDNRWNMDELTPAEDCYSYLSKVTDDYITRQFEQLNGEGQEVEKPTRLKRQREKTSDESVRAEQGFGTKLISKKARHHGRSPSGKVLSMSVF